MKKKLITYAAPFLLLVGLIYFSYTFYSQEGEPIEQDQTTLTEGILPEAKDESPINGQLTFTKLTNFLFQYLSVRPER